MVNPRWVAVVVMAATLVLQLAATPAPAEPVRFHPHGTLTHSDPREARGW